jgi:hypothetical protein
LEESIVIVPPAFFFVLFDRAINRGEVKYNGLIETKLDVWELKPRTRMKRQRSVCRSMIRDNDIRRKQFRDLKEKALICVLP